jgi:drug/metabolite transporter (DMT)-like permease
LKDLKFGHENIAKDLLCLMSVKLYVPAGISIREHGISMSPRSVSPGEDVSSLVNAEQLVAPNISPAGLSSRISMLLQDPAYVERILLFACIPVWFLVGVGAIVTTKILLTDWEVPPMLLTFQQLVVGSSMLRLVLKLSNRVQPLPWEEGQEEGESLKQTWGRIWEHHSDFLLSGLFNGLDFLASNTAFIRSDASFVESIKSSDPITTTAVALAWNVDRLEGAESIGLSLLILGVMLSTWGNVQTINTVGTTQSEAPILFLESVIETLTVLIANMCFAFRAMFQKRYRSQPGEKQLDDTNLLCRMQQTGALALVLPTLIAHAGTIFRATISATRVLQLEYLRLSLLNALCYSIYT